MANWAITIGINSYRYLQPLQFARQDADAIQQFFSHELGFQQVYHFTESAPPIQQDYGPDLDSTPTATTIKRFLGERFQQPFLREGDNLWFFFAGHGIREQNRDYLMPLDGYRADLAGSAIPLHYVSECLRRSGADNIIFLIDACRSSEGRRDGLGIGREKQQGVITLFSCSPFESSYEIQELQQGAFTHVLLDSLRIQGEGNCATVERLYQRLRYRVPLVTRQYKQVQQTPYGVIEPPSKNHLILLTRQATLADVETLKKDALMAEVRRDLRGARELWVRILAVSPADPEAIDGIERLRDARTASQGRAASPQQKASPQKKKATPRAAAAPKKPPQIAKSVIKPQKASSPRQHTKSVPKQTALPQSLVYETQGWFNLIRHRQVNWALKLLAGASSTIFLGWAFFQTGNNPPQVDNNDSLILPETIQDKINQDIERVGISADELASPFLAPGSYLELIKPLSLLSTPEETSNENLVLGQLSDGAIVQVLTRQELVGDDKRWVKLKFCAIAMDSQPRDSSASLTFGLEGWILEAQLTPVAIRTADTPRCFSD